MDSNRLHPQDTVRVTVTRPDGSSTAFVNTGFSDIRQAIRSAYESTPERLDIRDLTFTVENTTDHTKARYRVNAHDNITLIR